VVVYVRVPRYLLSRKTHYSLWTSRSEVELGVVRCCIFHSIGSSNRSEVEDEDITDLA